MQLELCGGALTGMLNLFLAQHRPDTKLPGWTQRDTFDVALVSNIRRP